jgi:DMSO reductase anchor subunit
MIIFGLLVAGTVWLAVRETKRRRRPAGITLILTLTWIGAVLSAWGADNIGAF